MSRINDPEQNPQPGPAVGHNLSQANVDITPQAASGDASQWNSGDFDDNATPLWSLYKEKSQVHDEAKIQVLTKSMTDVLLFAGLFAAALSPFIVDRSQAIQVTPAQQMVFYEQQSVDLLKQISAQISSLSLQASVPPPSPLPPLTANPSRSDIVVNALLFISLVLSLSAALLATLVQRWARDHMQIFHRYKHPLKVSRIRQYLHEGVDRWHMAVIAEAVPTLIHVSLFLFLVALAVFLSNANWAVAKPTIFFITLFLAWYLIATILPVAKPQFPLRSPVSVLLWFVVQSISPRLYKDSGDGEMKPVSQNMVDGLMDLALEHKLVRTYRDRRAIAWLARGLTGDAEMESFASSIPGSFNPGWGVRVWGRRKTESDGNSNQFSSGLAIENYDLLRPPPSFRTPYQWHSPRRINILIHLIFRRSSSTSHPQPLQVEGFEELCKRIGRLFQTCGNVYLFTNTTQQQSRSRTCVQAIASFVFRMRADLSWFGDIETIWNLLKAQGYKDYPPPALATQSFAANWTGLSIVIIQKMLVTERLKAAANTVLLSFAGPSRHEAISLARRIDNTLEVVWDHVEALGKDPRRHGDRPTTDEDTRHRELIDVEIEEMDSPPSPSPTSEPKLTKSPTIDACEFLLNPLEAQWKYLQSRLDWSNSTSQGPGAEQGAEQGTRHVVEQNHAISRLYRPTERQMWRLLDLHEGGAVGFTVELYLLSLKEILSASDLSHDSRDIFLSAVEAIASNRVLSECTIWTQKLILELILDIAANRGVFSDFSYPNFIEEELVRILRIVAAGLRDVSDIEHTAKDLKIPSRVLEVSGGRY
ncbi:hypothetical protein BGW80DRAFT_1458303 [Lactifluus volemus]|nr:hypothetical protein BGW80DRAFT_1458303 [Lactifluus volemus]